MPERIRNVSPRVEARVAGGLYLACILLGMINLLVQGGWNSALWIVGGAIYMVVTLLFYDLFRPVNNALSLLAALFSIAGFTLGRIGWRPDGIHVEMVCYGYYCLLLAYLIYKSTFLPRFLAVLMAITGLGWQVFLSPRLLTMVNPWQHVTGLLGEGSLTLWLLIIGVHSDRWRAQAQAAKRD